MSHVDAVLRGLISSTVKDLSISRVGNGWIVRNTEDYDLVKRSPDSVTVYTRIEDLQAALPELLGVPSPRPIVLPAQDPEKVYISRGAHGPSDL